MANIGDVWLRLGLEGNLEVDAKRQGKKAGDAAGKAMSGSLKASLADVFKGGLAFGGGAALAGGLDSAAAKLLDVFGDATQAALDEELSIAKLGTALKANIPAWNGNTDAIERTLKARMALGFADDEQRQSLALLVGATHDVDKALELQRTAMDLARLKGISLAEASDALIRVEGGQFRALKALGIVLPQNATATQALAAVQAVAAGQAEAYANTTAGKLLSAQVQVGEAMEKLGGVILPMVAEAANVVTFALDRTSVPLERMAEAAAKGSQGAAGQFRLLQHVAGELGISIERAWELSNEAGTMAVDVLRANMAKAGDVLDRSERSINQHAGASGDALTLLGDDAANMSTAIAAAGVSAAQSVENMRDRIVAAAKGVIDGAYAVLSAGDQLAATNAEISEKRRTVATGAGTAATDRQTASIDRKTKTLERAMSAERDLADAQLAAVDAQEKQLDVADKLIAVKERKQALNEQLNQAQLDLVTAQGTGDAQGVSDAMAAIADLHEQQAQDERQLGVDAQRDKLQVQRDEIRAKSQARQDELTALKGQLDEERRAIHSSGSAVVSDAKRDLTGLYATQADLVLTLAAAGAGGSKTVTDALDDMHARLTTAVGEEKLAILATITALQDLQDQAERTFVTLPGGLTVPRPVGAPGGPQVRERGGPVKRDVPYIVGERRPEIFVPGESGSIIPSMAAMRGGLSDTVVRTTIEVPVDVNLDGELLTRVVSRRQAEQYHR